VLWPPLYPALLALPHSLGMALEDAARMVQSFSAAACIACMGALAREAGGGSVARAGAALAALWSVQLVAPTVWSEAAFMALCCACALAWLRWCRAPGPASWWCFVALSAALVLVRYVGVVWIACAAAAVPFAGDARRVGARRRVVQLLAVGLAPALVWLLRNRWVAQAFDGRRGPPSRDWLFDLERAAHSLLPLPREAGALAWLAAIAAGAVLVAGVARLARPGARRAHVAPLLAFPLAFAAALVVLRHVVEFDPIDERLMAPALPFFGWIGIQGCNGWSFRSRTALLLAGSTWLCADFAPRAAERASSTWMRAREAGLGVYDSPRWRASALVRWTREELGETELWSNEPFALSLLAERDVHALPGRPAGYPRLYERWRLAGGTRTVIWFRLNRRAVAPWSADPSPIDVRLAAEFDEGEAWTVGAR
jgi:hypothetical protein